MSNFSETLKRIRKQRKMSQVELASKIGVSRSTISMYEMGEREPDFETLEAIADVFNVDMAYLIGSEMKKAPSEDGEDLADYLQDLRERPETRALLEASRGMTREQVEQMAAFAKALRGGQ